MIKKTKRKGFNFYRSYYDVFNELPDDQKLIFVKALFDKQFLDVEPNDLEGFVKIAWIGLYNSIDQQVKGYKTKTKDPMQGACQGVTQGATQGPSLQEKEKGKGKDEYTYTQKQDLIPTTQKIKEIEVDYVRLFIGYWNETRTKTLNKPSNLNRLRRDLVEVLKDIWESYTEEQIITALKGLFKQKKLPYDNTSILSQPDHFLNNFERYLTAGIDMNPQLYGTND